MAFELIVVGSSWGGMRAVARLLGSLPSGFEIPLAVAQHRPPGREELLERVLARSSQLEVASAHDKEPIQAGHVYVAPPDYHLLVEPGHFALSTEGYVHFSRPSIDVLFESAAEAYGERLIGVLLTGANTDGAEGLARIANAGGFTVVQDPATADRPEMPAAAVALGAARRVLPLDRIGPFLAELQPTMTGGEPR